MISIEHLTKSFGQRTVFQDLSLQFTEGKVYALIGNSGCGKTTLLNILAKLEPYEKGSISYLLVLPHNKFLFSYLVTKSAHKH